MGLVLFLFPTAMNMINKVSVKYILALMVSIILCILTGQSRDKHSNSGLFHTFLTSPSDTTLPSGKKNTSSQGKLKTQNDTLPKKIVEASDTIHIKAIDSLATDTALLKKNADTVKFATSKNAPDTVIEYTAEDSMVVSIPEKTITLYGTKATTQYKDNNLTAPIIALDQETGNIIASIKRDSTGKVISLPTYKQGDFLSQSDSIKFNMKSGKDLTKRT